MWTVYIAELTGGQLYVGMTSAVDRRLAWVRQGRGYAGSRGLVQILWVEPHSTRESAAAREKQLKGWSRAKNSR